MSRIALLDPVERSTSSRSWSELYRVSPSIFLGLGFGQSHSVIEGVKYPEFSIKLSDVRRMWDLRGEDGLKI